MDESEYNNDESQIFSQDILETHARRTGYTLSYFLIDFVKKHQDVQLIYGIDWKDTIVLLNGEHSAKFISGVAIARKNEGEETKVTFLPMFRLEIYDGPKTVKVLEYTEDATKNFKTCIDQALEELESLWFKV